jgi:hypothetical protein
MRPRTIDATTSTQQLGSLIKSARDIMRKDKGLSGDLDRVEVRWEDDFAQDDDGYILIHVILWSGCPGYELGVYGNMSVATTNCDQ